MPLLLTNNHYRPDLWDAHMSGSLLHDMGTFTVSVIRLETRQGTPFMARAVNNSTTHHMTHRQGVPDS